MVGSVGIFATTALETTAGGRGGKENGQFLGSWCVALHEGKLFPSIPTLPRHRIFDGSRLFSTIPCRRCDSLATLKHSRRVDDRRDRHSVRSRLTRVSGRTVLAGLDLACHGLCGGETRVWEGRMGGQRLDPAGLEYAIITRTNMVWQACDAHGMLLDQSPVGRHGKLRRGTRSIAARVLTRGDRDLHGERHASHFGD